MNLNRLGIAVVCAVLLQGCMTGPNYKRPDLKTPEKWHAAMNNGETDAAASVDAWWTTFGDEKLTSLITRAASGSFDLRAAEARLKEARAYEEMSGASLWPQVNTSAAYKRSQTRKVGYPSSGAAPTSLTVSPAGVGMAVTAAPAGATGPTITVMPDLTGGKNSSVTLRSGSGGGGAAKRQGDMFQAGFDASWELDIFGGNRRTIEAAHADTQAVEEMRRQVYISIAAEVARNYFELRSAQSRLATANSNIEAQKEALEIARSRFKAGLTSELDAKTAEAQLATSQSVVPSLEAAAQLAMNRLAVLGGQTPGALQEELGAATGLPATPPSVPVGLPADLTRRRPDLRKAERSLASSTARIGAAMAERYPKFSLTGSFTGASETFSGLRLGGNQLWSIGPGVRWNLFDGGRIRADIKVQNARQEQAMVAYEQTMMMALEEIEGSLVMYAKEQNRLVQLTEAITATQRALAIARELYEKGLVNFLNVIDAERSLFAVQDQRTQSETAVLTHLVALYKALGGGWESAYPEAPQAPAQ